MDKDIVFDTCMQIRHNYDGCKKGMRPSGGRCVPAKGRLNQEGGGGWSKKHGYALGAGLLGVGAATGLTAAILAGKKKGGDGEKKKKPIIAKGGKERKQLTGGKDFVEGEYTVVNEPKLPAGKKTEQKLLAGKKTEQKLLPAASKRDSAAQLVFDALSFVLSDRY